mgnify:FL=1
MAVPDTTTFTLQNVVDEIDNDDNLVGCFNDANANYFDSSYEGSQNQLLNFRNYGSQNALTQFTGSSGQNDIKFICNQSTTTNYWHNGSATYPQANDNVYTDSNGATSFGFTYMLTSGGGGYYLTFSSGRVTNTAFCSPP